MINNPRNSDKNNSFFISKSIKDEIYTLVWEKGFIVWMESNIWKYFQFWNV